MVAILQLKASKQFVYFVSIAVVTFTLLNIVIIEYNYKPIIVIIEYNYKSIIVIIEYNYEPVIVIIEYNYKPIIDIVT